jgi:hypothetical protein
MPSASAAAAICCGEPVSPTRRLSKAAVKSRSAAPWSRSGSTVTNSGWMCSAAGPISLSASTIALIAVGHWSAQWM